MLRCTRIAGHGRNDEAHWIALSGAHRAPMHRLTNRSFLCGLPFLAPFRSHCASGGRVRGQHVVLMTTLLVGTACTVGATLIARVDIARLVTADMFLEAPEPSQNASIGTAYEPAIVAACDYYANTTLLVGDYGGGGGGGGVMATDGTGDDVHAWERCWRTLGESHDAVFAQPPARYAVLVELCACVVLLLGVATAVCDLGLAATTEICMVISHTRHTHAYTYTYTRARVHTYTYSPLTQTLRALIVAGRGRGYNCDARQRGNCVRSLGDAGGTIPQLRAFYAAARFVECSGGADRRFLVHTVRIPIPAADAVCARGGDGPSRLCSQPKATAVRALSAPAAAAGIWDLHAAAKHADLREELRVRVLLYAPAAWADRSECWTNISVGGED